MSSVMIPDRSDAAEEFAPARFTVDEYFEMVARDAFAGLGRIELLEGRLVRKMTKNPPHRVALARTERVLRTLLPAGWHIANQEPVRLGSSAPEPDLAIVRGEVEDYSQRHPGPGDIAIVIEIADDSLRTDRRKAKTYAVEGIPEYWIVNVRDRSVETYRPDAEDRTPPTFAAPVVFREGDTCPVMIDGNSCGSIAVAELMP